MFKIGEFSKITQVPASSLRYYDEIDLFKPQLTDHDTGYRYYKVDQIPRLNLIVAYKELGLNLEQVKVLLENNLGMDTIKGLLLLHQSELEQKLQEDKARLKRVEARLRQIDQQNTNAPDSLVLKPIPKLNYCYLEQKFQSFSEAQMKMGALLKYGKNHIPVKTLGPLVAIMLQDCYEHENVELRLGLMLNEATPTLDNNTFDLKISELESIEFALSCVHLGPPNEMFLTRTSMAIWIEESEFEISGYGREVFLKPPIPGNLDDCAIELIYPLKSKNT